VLQERGGAFDVLKATHATIPALLAERALAQSALGGRELAGTDTGAPAKNLERIEGERARAVRMRLAAIETLLSQEPQLKAVRETLDGARASYASTMISEFEERYRAGVRALQALWREGDVLASALRAAVPMPIPARILGGEKPTANPLQIPEFETPRLVRVLGESGEIRMNPEAERIGKALDALDAALAFIAGIRTARKMERTIRVRESSRGFDPAGTFRVLHEFTNHADCLKHRPGELVDSSLVGVNSLHRLTSVKTIELVSAGVAVAA
jgi:hypothetical protein